MQTIKEMFKIHAKTYENLNKKTINDNDANDHLRFIDDHLTTIINADDYTKARHALMNIITAANQGLFKQSLKDGI